MNDDARVYTFTRGSLAIALAQLQIKIRRYTPETLKVDAVSMADAIIGALGKNASNQGAGFHSGEAVMRVTTYVTRDGARWLNVRYPDGLVPPPSIELHKPLAGAVTFYFAECFNLPVPSEAAQAEPAVNDGV